MNICIAISALVIGILLTAMHSEAQWGVGWHYPRYNLGRESWLGSGHDIWSDSGRDIGRYIRSDNNRLDSGHESWRDSSGDSDAGGDEVVSVGGGDKPDAQMQIVLDLHNKYRHQLATGGVPGQPVGSNVHDLVSSLSQDITVLA
ncbi:hypothetical protein ACTXT7_000468 [Hymenolepis weldensis]